MKMREALRRSYFHSRDAEMQRKAFLFSNLSASVVKDMRGFFHTFYRGGNPDRGILPTEELIFAWKERRFSLGIDRAAPQGRVS